MKNFKVDFVLSFKILNLFVVTSAASEIFRCLENIYDIKNSCTINKFSSISDTVEFKLNPNYNTNDITYLKFTNSNTTFTPSGIFIGLENIQTLDLSESRVSIISKSTFIFANFLQILNLTRNSITEVPDSVFEGAYNLVQINLSYNRITRINGIVFKNLKTLRNLDLSNNYLKILSSNIFPALLFNLNLNFNQIVQFSVTDLTNIENLSLNNNGLVFLKLNSHIKSFQADNNDLQSDKLFLNGNNLISLSLKNNSLRHFNTIQNMSNLVYLDMSDNPIVSTFNVRQPFKSLINLKTLILKSIDLNRFNFEIFSELLNLETFDISSNNLTFIDFRVISRLENLQYLKLGGNNINSITFNGLNYLFPKLKAIDISENNWTCSDLISVLTKFQKFQIKLEVDDENFIKSGTTIRGIQCSRTNKTSAAAIVVEQEPDLTMISNMELNKTNEMFGKLNLSAVLNKLNRRAQQISNLTQLIKEMSIETISRDTNMADSKNLEDMQTVILTKIDDSFINLYKIKMCVVAAVALVANLFIIYLMVLVFSRFSGKNQDRYNNYNFPTIKCSVLETKPAYEKIEIGDNIKC